MLKGLVAAAPDIAKVPLADFAAFNITEDNPQTSKVQSIQTTHINIAFTTNSGALAFVADMGSYILVYATEKADFNFTNALFSNAEAGSYDAKGIFKVNNTLSLNNGVLTTDGGVLFRIGYSGASALASNTDSAIGR